MSESLLNTPVLWINEYLKEKLAGQLAIGVPFFPSRPTNLDDLTEQWTVIADTQYSYSGILATWDRMIRLRRSPFPHVKGEELVYYFYATQNDVIEHMVQVQEAVLRLMDREDETAQEINEWAKDKTFGGLKNKFYFHRFKIYQLQEVRDIINFGTARTYGGNKIIIDFEYQSTVLKISFLDGSIYEYFDVPRNIYIKLVNADSQGRFARRHIYNCYSYRNIAKSAMVPAY